MRRDFELNVPSDFKKRVRIKRDPPVLGFVFVRSNW